jgi:hypothetical protein
MKEMKGSRRKDGEDERKKKSREKESQTEEKLGAESEMQERKEN